MIFFLPLISRDWFTYMLSNSEDPCLSRTHEANYCLFYFIFNFLFFVIFGKMQTFDQMG